MVTFGVADSTLFCRNQTDGSGWSVRIADILLIAEYTTKDGPAADDYFLVFVTREHGEFFYSAVTMAAEGMNAALERIEQQIEASLDLALASSPAGASRVVWPKELAGAAYFEFDEVEPETLWERVRASFKGNRLKQRLSDRVVGYLSAHAQTGEGVV